MLRHPREGQADLLAQLSSISLLSLSTDSLNFVMNWAVEKFTREVRAHIEAQNNKGVVATHWVADRVPVLRLMAAGCEIPAGSTRDEGRGEGGFG